MAKYGDPVFGTVEEKYPLVHTANGKIIGENRDKIAIFHGIPYGDRCDRERRFLPPEPMKPWEGVYDCTRNGNISIQLGESIAESEAFGFYWSGGGHPENFGVQYEKRSENCLYLNVLTPGLDGKKRPVMVYFHGGGYSSNSGSEALGADRFVREQDLVMVSVNHRLDVMGYLYLGHIDQKYATSANAGLLDLKLSLEWVRDNITLFGGDPDNVTICGESGGGSKVCHIMSMPSARGLFKRAIVESGAGSPGLVTVEDAAKITDTLLEKLGIKGDPDVIEKLLALPADALLMAGAGKRFGEGLPYGPAADDIVIMRADKPFAVPECARDIPVMVGSSEDEMAAFRGEAAQGVTPENLREKLLETAPSFGIDIDARNVDEILEVFRANNRKNDDAGHLLLKICSSGGGLTQNAYYMACGKAKDGGAPVYRYFNRLDVPHNYLPGVKYAWHTFDTPLFFRIVPYDSLEAYSKKTSAMWAQFARTGNPSTPDFQWPEFDLETKRTAVFDDAFTVEEDPDREEREVMEKYNGTLNSMKINA